MLSKQDFYDIAKYINTNWRGFFSDSDVKAYADEYYADYLQAKRLGYVERGSALDELIAGLVEDWENAYDGQQLGDWLETMAYDLGFRNFEELIREFSE